MIEEAIKPRIDLPVIDEPVLEVGMTRPCAGQGKAVLGLDQPAVHHLLRHFRMELDGKCGPAVTERLVGKVFTAGRQAGCATDQIEPFAVPLINPLGPGTVGRAVIGRLDVIIADLGAFVGIAVDLSAKLAGQHLPAQADAEIGHAGLQRAGDPVDLFADIVMLGVVVGAHRPAEDDRAGIILDIRGQGATQRRPEDVQRVALLQQLHADASWRRRFLVQYDGDPLGHECVQHTPLIAGWATWPICRHPV